MKKRNAYVVIALFALSVVLTGCSGMKVFYEPEAKELQELRGKTFLTLYDAYIIKFPARDKEALPQIATGARVPGLRFLALPEEADPALIGRILNSQVKVLDVVPKGTRFSVTELRREERPVYGISRSFEIEFVGPLKTKWTRVDGRWITNPQSSNPFLYPEFIREVPKGG